MTVQQEAVVEAGLVSWVDQRIVDARDPILLLARLAMSAIFVQSGFGKILGFGGFVEMLAGQGIPFASLFALVGVCVEFGGGLAILLGAWTRLAAVALAVFTAIAALIAHRYWSAPEAMRMMQQIQFMKNLAIVGGFLALLMSGAGRYSLDALPGRRMWNRLG